MSLLRRRQDWRSLAFVALAIGLLAVPHAWIPPDWLIAPWLCISAFLCFASSIVNHNHMHCPTLSSAGLNRSFNLLLTVARGHTASGVVVPHNLNHHVEANTQRDWIRPELAGRGLGWVRLVRYVASASANMLVQRLRSDAPRLPRDDLPAVVAEKLTIVAIVVAAAAHDWRVFLLFNVLPWLVGLAFLVGVNLLQHDGCDARTPLGESRNFTSPVGNWLLFNNGFHTAHHLEPWRHWSELPELHRAIRLRLGRPDLELRSILAFLWRFGFSRTAEAPSHG